MEEKEAEELLQKVEEEVSKGNYDLKGLGFWKLVAQAKKNPKLVEKFGSRISEVDQKAFKNWAWLTVSITTGHVIELAGTVIALALLYTGLTTTTTLGGISLVLSALILSATLHPFAHYLVGNRVGIDFTFYFPDGPALIEPTLKTDYATYLKASPKDRAMMHLAGPVMTSLGPLIVLILGMASGALTWAVVLVGVVLLFNASSEIAPLILLKLNVPKILFADFRKTDTYRTLREWKIYKSLEG
ncbi:MAG: hypothetical protein ACE5G7_02660 [Candidatus Hydrothermarchaeaceae archaeon]